MKKSQYISSSLVLTAALIVVMFAGCERDFSELDPASFPTTAEVFIDGFTPGLAYEAWGDVKAFEVDKEVSYEGTASMRFAVPDQGETGGYAGGRYTTSMPRDLTGYDALTFWIKASKAATLDEIGFGNNAQGSLYQTTLKGLKINTNWKKAIIPIPEPSKLASETGMLFYAESPEEGVGYTFWIDEVKFEKLGTIAHPQPAILEGQDQTIAAETGDLLTLGGMYSLFNMPDGTNQRVEVAPGYFTFSSTDEAVASVNDRGQVLVGIVGKATVTATLDTVAATGSIEVESIGTFPTPETPAPTPTLGADSVISLFSNAYTDVQVDTWNPFWEYSTAEVSDKQIDGDDVKLYRNLNFVGIEFVSQTVDASAMTHFHLDIWTPGPVDGAEFAVTLVDFGADNGFGGGDDSSIEFKVSEPTLEEENWIGIEIPLSGLAGKGNMAQMVLACSGNASFNSVYIDNVYFYIGEESGGDEDGPQVAAPNPTQDADDVISIFSDAYTNLEGTDYPDWGQTTQVTNVPVEGNSTLKFENFDFQGVQLANSLDVSGKAALHLDFWTQNATALNVYLISTGPVETAYALTVPTDGWSSVDIPLTSFSPVNLAEVIQLKFDGNGVIYLDNIYFHGGSGGATEPETAAPTPSHAEADVISIFSDAYTDVNVDTYLTEWSNATLDNVTVEGNATMKYSGMDVAGIETIANPVDASTMTHFHVDVWSADFTSFGIKMVDLGADGVFGGGDDVEQQLDFTPAQGEWVSLDIPLTDFTGLTTKAHIGQYILVGQPTGTTTVYVDNIYFHK